MRFSVIGQLLAAPPPQGELRCALAELAAREWRHPVTGEPVRFGLSTIERWHYRARKERHDPVGILRRKVRTDSGRQVAMGAAVCEALLAQYAAHRSWSARLHHDNLVALAAKQPALRPVPSYSTLRRFLHAHGLDRRRPRASRRTAGVERAEARLDDREVRSYEAEHAGIAIMDRARSSPRAASGARRSCSACSTIARGWPVTCNGAWRRPPRTSRMGCRRRSRSAACRAPR